MKPPLDSFDVAIVGGGLSGLATAATLSSRRVRVVLLDQPVFPSRRSLGGFAHFSGAKFSLPPAGMGLLSVARNRDRLTGYYAEAIRLLGLKIPRDFTRDGRTHLRELGHGLQFRPYRSVLLTSSEIAARIARLTKHSRLLTIVRSEVVGVHQRGREWHTIALSDAREMSITTKVVVLATGRRPLTARLPPSLLAQPRRPADIGARIEFLDIRGLAGLSALGPDAKVLKGRCRTFCVNAPGAILRYSFDGIPIPGGIALSDSTSANFGVLARLDGVDVGVIRKVGDAARALGPELTSPAKSLAQGLAQMAQLYPAEVVNDIGDFCRALGAARLVDWTFPYQVHVPLLEWCWPTYSLEDTFETSAPRVFATGDASGHARGLLQAVVSGVMCAREVEQCL